MKLLDWLRCRTVTKLSTEIEEELRSHIQHRADDLERSGLGRSEAERRARIEFDGSALFNLKLIRCCSEKCGPWRLSAIDKIGVKKSQNPESLTEPMTARTLGKPKAPGNLRIAYKPPGTRSMNSSAVRDS